MSDELAAERSERARLERLVAAVEHDRNRAVARLEGEVQLIEGSKVRAEASLAANIRVLREEQSAERVRADDEQRELAAQHDRDSAALVGEVARLRRVQRAVLARPYVRQEAHQL